MRPPSIPLTCSIVFACAGDPSDTTPEPCAPSYQGPPDCAVERALREDTLSGTDDCYDWPVWPPGCGQKGADRTLSRDGLVLATSAFFFNGLGRAGPFTITDASTFDAFVASLDVGGGPPEVPSVDFGTHIVAVLHHYQGSSCGIWIADHGVSETVSGAPAHVFMELYDTSGACSGACDISFAMLVMYAVPRAGGSPVMCIERQNTCD